ncbi:hypothetical protein GCM10025862_40750 [Arsenicicoccus piscis]|uniref:Heavy metal translocating P-type ATPase n=1 Tax=Arsenicicoccus piscis TaxID=673954 RepID=A0ABQ6HW01_9MICO|nr:hypothetical protein GCM10025862_40750 [Arsenicicoccus piscis]
MDHSAHAGHGDHGSGHGNHAGQGDHVGQFRRLFWINLVIAVPVVALSPMFAMLIGYSVPGWAGWALRRSAPSCTSGAAGRSSPGPSAS